jgi:Tfp pilus assembly protein PilN
MTTVLPVVPQRAPRRQRHWLSILVAALVGLPIGALAALGLFVLILVCTPGTLP